MSSNARPTKTAVVTEFRRTQILGAARQSFVRTGIADTTVDGIARLAGVAKGTVYLYYRSKDDILQQLVGQDLTEFQQDTVPVVQAAGTIEDRLHRFFGAALAFFDHKRDFIDQCVFEMTPDVRRKARQKLGAVFAVQAETWRVALAEAARSRAISKADVDGVAHNIVSLAHGLAIQRLRGWSTEPIATTVARATRMVWEGLAVR